MNKTRALFIGNSYTMCNDLPGMVTKIAASLGHEVETGMIATGGQTLEGHMYNCCTKETIEGSQWDFVVLQEQSTRPIEEPKRMLSAATRIVAWVRSVGAAPVFYLTWSRRHLPDTQDDLDNAYHTAARALDAGLAPVGPAWAEALRLDPELSFYVEDGSHPTVPGSYLAACVFTATLLQVNPAGGTRELSQEDGTTLSIAEDTAVRLQEAAWNTVSASGGGPR